MAENADEIEVRLPTDQVASNVEVAHQEIIQLVRETLTQAAPNGEDNPPPFQT